MSIPRYFAMRICHLSLCLIVSFDNNSLPYCINRDSKTWSTSGIDGVHRFLARVWRLIVGSPSVDGKFKGGTVELDGEPSVEQLRCLHRCINKVIFSVANDVSVFLLIFTSFKFFVQHSSYAKEKKNSNKV